MFYNTAFNPLSANVVHALHEANIACSSCSTSHRKIRQNGLNIFERGETLLQNGTHCV